MKIPNSKSQIPNKLQISNPKLPKASLRILEAWKLEFGICLGFGIWDLGFHPRSSYQ
jgi:hypothetical protein